MKDVLQKFLDGGVRPYGSVFDKAKKGLPNFEERLEDVVALVEAGFNMAQVAEKLCISKNTLRARFEKWWPYNGYKPLEPLDYLELYLLHLMGGLEKHHGDAVEVEIGGMLIVLTMRRD